MKNSLLPRWPALLLLIGVLPLLSHLITGSGNGNPSEGFPKTADVVASTPALQEPGHKSDPGSPESTWFYRQRAFPNPTVDARKVRAGLQQAYAHRKAGIQYQASRRRAASGWEFKGPLNTGGRITAISLHPDDIDNLLVGSASGGVFRSLNGADSWESVLPEAASLSIGSIARSDSDPDVVYAGTGEPNAGGGSLAYDGNGIWKSVDGGASWTPAGLEGMGSTGKLVVDPTNPDVVYAAMMGDLFANTADRGIYKSTDGGASWNQVLFVNDSTGGIDLAIRPDDPDVVFAATWQRVRRASRRDYGGSGCRIWRSTDGGSTWLELGGGLPNDADVGRIGIAVTPANPDRVYALIMNRSGSFRSFQRSDDGGDSWGNLGPAGLGGNYATYGWWFSNVFTHPSDPDHVTVTGLQMLTSLNGGSGFPLSSGSGVHVDQHAWVAHPLNPDLVYIGNDGGLYRSTDAGNSWTHLENLPVTQFYTAETDANNPLAYYGGTQDNGTIRTLSAGFLDWETIYGGDGFVVLVDPSDPNYVYAEFQYGGLGRSTDGGNSFGYALSGIDFGDRFNWKSPLTLDPFTPSTLYFGSQKIYRSEDRAQTWSAISGDLTNGSTGGNLVFASLTTIAVSPVDPQVIWSGADDGSVHRTDDGGTSWTRVDATLPGRWITHIEAHPDDPSSAVVSVSGFRWNENDAHIWRTTDAGASWEQLASGLPDLPVNDVVIDPDEPARYYAATDGGVYTSSDAGLSWVNLYEGLPVVVCTDLVLDKGNNRLVVATYGRGMYELDLLDLPANLEEPEIADFRIVPNPSNGLVNLELNADELAADAGIYLIHPDGRSSSLSGVPLVSGVLDLSQYPAGHYRIVLEYRQGNQNYRTERGLVLQR